MLSAMMDHLITGLQTTASQPQTEAADVVSPQTPVLLDGPFSPYLVTAEGS